MSSVFVKGRKTLSGKVRISGAKNASLPELAAALLTDKELILEGVPWVKDVETMLALLKQLGTEVNVGDKISLQTHSASGKPEEDLFKAMRASVLILGPMLTRFGRAEILWPGGCSIGERPIDFHIEAMRKMGAEIEETQEKTIAKARGLKGSRIRFPRKSVTATENVILAASLAKGETLIENPSLEPEVVDLTDMLKKMGARIDWQNDGLHIEGVRELGGAVHHVIPDRIESGTFLVIGALISSELEIEGCFPHHLRTVVEKLKEAGVKMEVGEDKIVVKGGKDFLPLEIQTGEYPGFPTDMQAQIMVLLCFANGNSLVKDNIFPDRFHHALELKKMGADIEKKYGEVIIKGGGNLKGTKVKATDLRASASLVIAGLVADGETEITDIYHLKRGYENFFEKLRSIGADVRE